MIFPSGTNVFSLPNIKRSMAKYWIFVSYPYSEFNSGTISEMKGAIKETRKWPIGKRTPRRKQLREGDKVLFYQAGDEGKKFVGKGELTSNLQIDEKERFDYVHFSNILLFSSPVPVNKILSRLSFIKDEKSYGHHFQGGVVRISENDYKNVLRIAHNNAATGRPTSTKRTGIS